MVAAFVRAAAPWIWMGAGAALVCAFSKRQRNR